MSNNVKVAPFILDKGGVTSSKEVPVDILVLPIDWQGKVVCDVGFSNCFNSIYSWASKNRDLEEVRKEMAKFKYSDYLPIFSASNFKEGQEVTLCQLESNEILFFVDDYLRPISSIIDGVIKQSLLNINQKIKSFAEKKTISIAISIPRLGMCKESLFIERYQEDIFKEINKAFEEFQKDFPDVKINLFLFPLETSEYSESMVFLKTIKTAFHC